MRRTPERTNGLIKVPESLLNEVSQACEDTLISLRASFLLRLVKEKSVAFEIDFDTKETVYGFRIPDFRVRFRVVTPSAESYTDEGAEIMGQFFRAEITTTGLPTILIVIKDTEIVSRNAIRNAMRWTHRSTIEHELRHFVQWIIEKNTGSPIPGRPTRKARSAREAQSLEGLTPYGTISLNDEEFHTMLGDLVNEYREDVAAGYVDLDRAMRELTHTEFFETLRRGSPERWKAAIRIAYGELSTAS